MTSLTNAICPCMPYMDRSNEIEARYRQAKEAMLRAQQQNCEATHEFLAARAEVQQLLEAVFPEPGTLNHQST